MDRGCRSVLTPGSHASDSSGGMWSSGTAQRPLFTDVWGPAQPTGRGERTQEEPHRFLLLPGKHPASLPYPGQVLAFPSWGPPLSQNSTASAASGTDPEPGWLPPPASSGQLGARQLYPEDTRVPVMTRHCPSCSTCVHVCACTRAQDIWWMAQCCTHGPWTLPWFGGPAGRFLICGLDPSVDKARSRHTELGLRLSCSSAGHDPQPVPQWYFVAVPVVSGSVF